MASELPESRIDETDESEFLLTTFQEVVARLKEKERELSALHQLEKARADETEALASDIIRSMTTGLVSLDPSGTVVLVNPAAERIFDLEAAKVLKLPFAEVFPGSPAFATRADEALELGAYHLRGQPGDDSRGGPRVRVRVRRQSQKRGAIGRRENGAPELDRARTRSSAAAHHALGVTELISGNASGAVAPLEQAVAAAPDNVDYHFSLAQTYEELDRIPESLAAYEAYVQHARPDDARAPIVRKQLELAKKALAERERERTE